MVNRSSREGLRAGEMAWLTRNEPGSVSTETIRACISNSGASAGTARFTTTVGQTDFAVTNFVVSPRLVFRPLRVIWPDKRRLGFLQMHYRPTIRFGQVDGSDFGVPANTFSAGTEFMPKGGS